MKYSKVKLNISNLKHTFSIDTLGVVRNETNGKVLKGTSITKNNRYVKIHLDKFYPLHRLVATTFLPNIDNLPQVNHKDGNRYNNTASNLEWCSSSYNVKHAFNTNLKQPQIGEKNGSSKLTEEEVLLVRALGSTTLTARQIRDRLKLDVSLTAIKSVRRRDTWTHI